MGWVEANDYRGPTLFVKGQNSEYSRQRGRSSKQFPQAKEAKVIANTTHYY